MFRLFLLIVTAFQYGVTMNSFVPIAITKQGKIKGLVEVTDNGITYLAFHSVPYAKPPLGSLRFKAPVPPEPWEGIRNGQEESAMCYQKNLFANGIVEGVEDCLYVNVYTPQLLDNEVPLKPVMVYFHGGLFVAGSASQDLYDPDYLIRKDVVVVTVYYRLGVFGFLSLEDKSLNVSGNAGLKDQVMALKWVQENIKQFGGDPNCVTLFGNSAGSVSVVFHMVSPMSKGLFHRAILESGALMTPWIIGRKFGPEIIEKIEKTATNDAEILNILQALSMKELLGAQDKFLDDLNPSVQRYFAPIIEGESDFEPTFLTDDPWTLLKEGKVYKVPILAGYQALEGLLFDAITPYATFNTDLENMIPYFMGVTKGSDKSKEIAKKIKEFYYGDEEPSEEVSLNFNTVYSDVQFVLGIYKTLEVLLDIPDMEIYLYKFAYRGRLNLLSSVLEMMEIDKKYATHTDELGYLFKISLLPPFEEGSNEEVIMKRMTTWWANFARYRNPNAANFSEEKLLPVIWPKLNKGDIKCLQIDNNLTILNHPERKMLEFWQSLNDIASSS